MTHGFKFSTAIAAAFVLLFSTSDIRAQEYRLPPAVLGFGVSYDYGYGFAVDGDLTDQTYKNYLEMKLASLQMIFPKLFGNGAGISMTFGYGEYFMHADGTNPRVIANGSTFNTAETHVLYDLTMKAAQMDFMFYGQMGDIARVEIGPWGGIGFLPRYNLEETIVTPGVTFNDGSIRRNEFEAPQDGFVVHGGLAFRTSLEIPFIFGMALLPEAHVRTAVVFPQGDDRQAGIIGTAGLGLGILFGRPNGEEIPPPPPAPPTSRLDTVLRIDTVSVAPPQTIRAAVDLYSSDGSGRRTDTLLLSPTQTLHRIEVPMMTTLHFEENSASLPSRYTGLTASTRSDFTLDALVGASPMELHSQRLNIIGLRMIEEKKSTITITGSSAADEPQWFAEARAKGVKKYLTETWGVDAKRIITKGTKSRAGAQVELTSTSGDLLGPITAEWIDQEIDAAPIGVEPQFASARGVRSWRIAVTQNGQEIGVVRNSDAPGTASIDASMIVRNAGAQSTLPALNAELVVEDSSGAVTIARDEMPVLTTSSASSDLHPKQSISTFALFDSDSASVDRSISRIVASAGDSAEIVVRPTVDGNIASGTLDYVGDRLRQQLEAQGKKGTRLSIERAETGNAAGTDPGTGILIAVSERR